MTRSRPLPQSIAVAGTVARGDPVAARATRETIAPAAAGQRVVAAAAGQGNRPRSSPLSLSPPLPPLRRRSAAAGQAVVPVAAAHAVVAGVAGNAVVARSRRSGCRCPSRRRCRSAPPPPSTESLPAPASIRSLPGPQTILSSPPSALTTLFPGPQKIWSGPAVPVMRVPVSRVAGCAGRGPGRGARYTAARLGSLRLVTQAVAVAVGLDVGWIRSSLDASVPVGPQGLAVGEERGEADDRGAGRRREEQPARAVVEPDHVARPDRGGWWCRRWVRLAERDRPDGAGPGAGEDAAGRGPQHAQLRGAAVLPEFSLHLTTTPSRGGDDAAPRARRAAGRAVCTKVQATFRRRRRCRSPRR